VLGACVIDAHPAIRSNVTPAKAELMKLFFMVSSSDWFLQVDFSTGESRICHTDEGMPIGL
jgi:hypothetical protein